MIAITETTPDGRSIRVEADTVDDAVAAMRKMNPCVSLLKQGVFEPIKDHDAYSGPTATIAVVPDPNDNHRAYINPVTQYANDVYA